MYKELIKTLTENFKSYTVGVNEQGTIDIVIPDEDSVTEAKKQVEAHLNQQDPLIKDIPTLNFLYEDQIEPNQIDLKRLVIQSLNESFQGACHVLKDYQKNILVKIDALPVEEGKIPDIDDLILKVKQHIDKNVKETFLERGEDLLFRVQYPYKPESNLTVPKT